MANTTHTGLNNFISETHHHILYLLYQELKFDKEADSWILMSSPWPVLSILFVYYIFVQKIGPKMMENREPMNIKHIMMAYNLGQTFYNFYIVSAITTTGLFNYLLRNTCYPDYTENNRALINTFYVYSWHYFLSKVFDLLDTVFFVLRKKQSHVTFLHVYHHMNMVVTTWIFLRFIKGHQGAFCGIVNASIHTIMYSYYFLAALGPHMKKYLWWKEHLTRLQIIQFIWGLIYGASLLIYDCNTPKLFTFYMLLDVLLFLYLFLVFYKNTYNQKKKSQ